MELQMFQHGGTSAKLSLDVATLSGYFILAFIIKWRTII